MSDSYPVTAIDCVTNTTLVSFNVVCDIEGPVSAVTATVGTTPMIWVSWSADDSTNGAGVQDYDVEYAVDEGACTGWFTDTQALSGTLAGQAGHAYTFRVRATDRVSNTGVWAETTVTRVLPVRALQFVDGQIGLRRMESVGLGQVCVQVLALDVL